MAKQVEATDAPAARVMLDEREVLQITKLSRTTRHRLETMGRFPRAVYAAPNAKRWFLDQIIAWQKELEENDWFNVRQRRRGPGRPPKKKQREAEGAA